MIITNFKKGDKVKPIEKELIKRFGKNHGMNCDKVLEFLAVYSENRNVGTFEDENGMTYSLKATDVKLIN